MNQAQFALAWSQYKKNICNGLSSLQQNGEFVDMTLAADGHFVKVHQVVMALASPFIKQLISSANCPHPIIFLNKISNATLCSILEYIYTGEVLLTLENFDEFIEAGRELHIQGLENMKSQSHKVGSTEDTVADDINEVCYFEVPSQSMDEDQTELDFENTIVSGDTKDIRIMVQNVYDDDIAEESLENDENLSFSQDVAHNSIETSAKPIDTKNVRVMQYTVSNQGSLQMILNRFLYYLKHTNRNNTRQWRCVDYVSGVKCPAHVITKDDIVIQRISAHTHPFHDKKILKKVRAGAIFSAIQEAEIEGTSMRKKTENNTQIDTE
ncbi:unnamed protein product [Diatraea saccharalis]|uniref:BTB domain-containing protein n=1 Tax=Diatraea saccharalis TaxID=40085 RepID=A0A9N9QXJ9_9NEOP|nr:unnamed protein product [Diatraea saccharalis]